MPYPLVRLAIAAIAAALPLNVLTHLPPVGYNLGILCVAGALLIAGQRATTDIAVVLLLFLWSVEAGRQTEKQIALFSSGPVTAEVRIEQILPQSERVKVRIVSRAGKPVFPPVFALLSGQKFSDAVCRGQRWRMTLRLKPVHARLNEAGFDAQRFAIATRTPLAGRMSVPVLLNPACSWRDRIISSSRKNYGELPWQAPISGLAFGERDEVSREITQLLRETGTAHLMAISGMHTGLAATLGWLIARLLQLFFPARWIGYRFPLALGLLVALIYGWLSGGNPPATRAIVALSVWSAIRLKGWCCSHWQVWSLCIGAILFFDPLSALSDSLWLSATAVAGLLFWYQCFPLPARFTHKRRWLILRLLHLQLGLLLLLMPVQMFIFHGISFTALVANLWAVPVVTLLTVPLIFCALLLNFITPAGQFIWWCVDRTLALLFFPLEALPSGWIAVNQLAPAVSLLVWLVVIAWRLTWFRTSPFTLMALCASLFCWRLNVARPEWRLDMLDVGHGLAVVISRQGEAVIYDTGNRWQGGDAALSYILPWLSWQGLSVRHLILSHGHLDHIGGLESVQAAFPKAVIHSSAGVKANQPCLRGNYWRWQNLTFQVLWPERGETKSGNNQSCVVAVSDGRWRVLLTGDIEAPAELELVRLYRHELRADIVQVPHHGSGTSSTPPFLRAVAGQAALASAARYSAWRLPALRVIKRYRENHYKWHDTAVEGQISVKFYQQNWQVSGMRGEIMPRWYHQWFGVPRDSR
ncbi:ComEC family protein [Erwinia sp. P6884]|uniref:ComEC family protein n=1 Tax=Erwinia sp. P6884 TaxID=3141450 RepID=UPI003197944B